MYKTKTTARKKRHRRIRARILGTPERPRLFVFKSNKHIYGSIIDDTQGKTIISFSDCKLSAQFKNKNNTEAARKLGEKIGKAALKEGTKRVVFDRGGYNYHGKVKAFAEGARSAGLEF